ncbi:hypothetical protein HPB51_021151 [Rhipicephalus microplus]|uniref:HTH CENPB-type domain-containing protein n=1 Tax=Rhipicephalus microplus TaxID=6941 RepID=A0A9J6DWB1_RHIMP|nr:hypothetical protein HPB51_021151 [Rhipicephalus microplus]
MTKKSRSPMMDFNSGGNESVNGVALKAKQAHGAKLGNLDEALLTWFQQACAAGINFGGVIKHEKAMEIAYKLGVADFAALNDWIECFRKRHGIAWS